VIEANKRFQSMGQSQSGIALPIKISIPFQIISVVTRSHDGQRVTLILVNRHPDKAADIGLNVGSAFASAKATLTVLADDLPDDYVDVPHPVGYRRFAQEAFHWGI
jgi:hypothetical protein